MRAHCCTVLKLPQTVLSDPITVLSDPITVLTDPITVPTDNSELQNNEDLELLAISLYGTVVSKVSLGQSLFQLFGPNTKKYGPSTICGSEGTVAQMLLEVAKAMLDGLRDPE